MMVHMHIGYDVSMCIILWYGYYFRCVSHIVDTYLQSINYCTFFEWIRSKEVHVYVTEQCESNLNDEW